MKKNEITDYSTIILNNLNNSKLLKPTTFSFTADDEGFNNFINGTG